MAELNTNDGGKGGGKVRSKKMNPGVDLTAMVDLAFLLITFFILTTTLSKPQSMNLAMPDKDKKDTVDEPVMDVAENRTLTLLLGEDNKIVWYYGLLESPLEEPEVTGYGKEGIRKVLLEKKEVVRSKYTDEKKQKIIVLIKPSDKSVYRNLVDVLDEMAITNVEIYAIVDITPDEVELLTSKGAYPSNKQ